MLRVRANPTASGWAPLLGVLVGGTLFAMLAGLGTAVMGTFAAALFGSILLGVVALFVPIRWLVIALLCMSFLIAGQLIYFARIEKALWFPFLAGALMLVRYPLDRMQQKPAAGDAASTQPFSSGPVRVLIIVFFATLAASSIVNEIAPIQLLVSLKEYTFLWGLYLVLVGGLVSPTFVSRIWGILPWLVVLQLPLVVYQRFIVAPSRRGIGAEWDSVVGAFGGNPNGGGANGAMGLFCVVAILIVIARWRRGLVSGRQALLIGSCGVLSIGLAEVKFMVLILPVGFFFLFLREFTRKPIKGILALSVGVLLAFSLLVSYKFQYGTHRQGDTISEYFVSMFSASTNPDFVNLKTREIGRLASIKFWYDQHGMDQPFQLLLGHGAGSSRVGDYVVGDAAKPWPFNIARSALPLLLWETGLIGTAAYISFLLLVCARAYRLSNDSRLDAESSATTGSMAVAVLLLATTLPYTTDLLYSHQTTILLMLCMGYVAMMNGQINAHERNQALRSAAVRFVSR